MFRHIFLISFCIYLSECTINKETFEGYKVYRLQPTTKEQYEFLRYMEKEDALLDFWTGVNKIGIPVDIMVPPEMQQDFVQLINENGIKNEVIIADIDKKIKNESIQTNARGGLTWTSYYGLDDIYTWMESLADSHGDSVSIFKAGTTYQKREIKGLKLSYGEGRRGVFIEGGIHAREWISPATVTYIINELINSDDPDVRQLAESFDWYFVPVFNPDGYIYTHKYYRLWRKTRSGAFYQCKGVDANRNWDNHWGEAGTSKYRCSETFGGDKPFSETETSSISDFINTIGYDLDAYLAFHSYSQLMLMPYGHTEEHLDNYGDVLDIGKKAVEALSRRYGTKYKVGNIAETIYKASGGSMDWVKGTFQVPIAFTYELRDTGKHGFMLPAEQIIPNSEEVMDSIIAIFKEADVKGMVNLKKTDENNNNMYK